MVKFSIGVTYACTLMLILLASAEAPTTTLRSAGEQAHLLIGAAVRPSLFSETTYSATLAREFNMIEPEDAMKWSVVRRHQGFDFRQGDEVVQFAQEHGMKVRGHCLVWDHDNPRWLSDGHFTPTELSQLLHEHIATEMKHYARQVFAWDVVNEALNEKGEAKDSIWYNAPGIGLSGQGTAYVERAFRWAHEAEPHALLFYNEAGGEGLNVKSDAIYRMVRSFKQRGVPIDGVGLQMHITTEFDADALEANIERLTKLGLQVHITELDVSLPVRPDGTASDTDLEAQADVYRSALNACIANSGCTAFQTWGFTDKWSWIGSHSHGSQGAALLFDRGYKPKRAYGALLRELLAGPQKIN